jgi:hypothetical protein
MPAYLDFVSRCAHLVWFIPLHIFSCRTVAHRRTSKIIDQMNQTGFSAVLPQTKPAMLQSHIIRIPSPISPRSECRIPKNVQRWLGSNSVECAMLTLHVKASVAKLGILCFILFLPNFGCPASLFFTFSAHSVTQLYHHDR